MNMFIQQGCIKLIKIGNKAFCYELTLFFFYLSIHQRILEKFDASHFPQKYEAAQLF